MNVPASLSADAIAPDEPALLATLSSLARSGKRATHGMPGAFYSSVHFAELERRRVFRRTWVCVGHVGEIPGNGDYFTTELTEEPLLIQRDAQGEVHVLANVCRHRGNLVALGRGNARVRISRMEL
jgi:choline monooxygenase